MLLMIGWLAAAALLAAAIRGAIVDQDAAVTVAFDSSPIQANTGQSSASSAAKTLDELCAEHALAIDIRTGSALNVVMHPPFVIAGDMSHSQLQAWRDETILPFARALAHQYFDCVPELPITVLLFSSKAAYRNYARQWCGDVRVSRFGYYKPDRRTLLANVEDGPAPLLHELAHALMACDFPTAPAWLREGMAVMCESAVLNRDCNLQIRELPPWRMQALQQAVGSARLPPFAELFAQQDLAAGDEAVAYAQAGGLCLLLHERCMLANIYRQSRDARENDAEVSRVLSTSPDWFAADDIDAVFRNWLAHGAEASIR